MGLQEFGGGGEGKGPRGLLSGKLRVHDDTTIESLLQLEGPASKAKELICLAISLADSSPFRVQISLRPDSEANMSWEQKGKWREGNIDKRSGASGDKDNKERKGDDDKENRNDDKGDGGHGKEDGEGNRGDVEEGDKSDREERDSDKENDSDKGGGGGRGGQRNSGGNGGLQGGGSLKPLNYLSSVTWEANELAIAKSTLEITFKSKPQYDPTQWLESFVSHTRFSSKLACVTPEKTETDFGSSKQKVSSGNITVSASPSGGANTGSSTSITAPNAPYSITFDPDPTGFSQAGFQIHCLGLDGEKVFETGYRVETMPEDVPHELVSYYLQLSIKYLTLHWFYHLKTVLCLANPNEMWVSRSQSTTFISSNTLLNKELFALETKGTGGIKEVTSQNPLKKILHRLQHSQVLDRRKAHLRKLLQLGDSAIVAGRDRDGGIDSVVDVNYPPLKLDLGNAIAIAS
ncbi:hypothetical protein BDP27DRAFT_1416877 [Rhodocollybia butyracea]|uniref:Uncharacterized protein n=1 Tax=Rhodocollybia butyracea TaxID=206335 RepID=A0A9P5Q2E1_9AGAR|nr:hypothetical protein BDP27DRAFT_1416877 [Rhodocollybia butyracea]